MTISILIAFKNRPGEVREMTFEDENEFWLDFRNSQEELAKTDPGERIFALLPKIESDGVPDEL